MGIFGENPDITKKIDAVDPNDPNIVEKLNEIHKESQEEKTAPAKPIGTSSLDEQERKIQALNKMIDERMQPLKEEISENTATLQQIATWINQQIAQAPQQMPPPQQDYSNQQQQMPPMQGMTLNDVPPEVKAKMLSEVGTSLAQIIRAWKGDNPSQAVSHNDIYGEMFKQMGLDIVQAGLDGIKQQIYPQFVPQPRQMNYQVPRGLPQQQQPQQRGNNNNETTGFA